MNRIHQVSALFAIIIMSCVSPSVAPACTGITVRPEDGSIIFGRTLEFAVNLKSNIIVVPRDKEYVGATPSGKPGLRWKTKYGVVGVSAFNLPITLDGLNEQGLAVGLFYFPGFAKYQEILPEDIKQALAPWELGVYLLGTCADVPEAIATAKNVRVGAVVQPDMGIVPPAHFIVTDAHGNCVVLEHIDGELKIYTNPLGVMSNSPGFEWHMTNLSNYVNTRVNNVPSIDVGGEEIKAFGQGSGMLGLPGDFTPPSRFVRAVAFSKSAAAGRYGAGGRAASVSHSEPIRYSQRCGARRRRRAHCGRLHSLDKRFRPDEPAVLLPHIREQPHLHGRFESGGFQGERHPDDLDAGRRAN